ncbi:hypothetical protein D3C75_977440 [compost metagenome]
MLALPSSWPTVPPGMMVAAVTLLAIHCWVTSTTLGSAMMVIVSALATWKSSRTTVSLNAPSLLAGL